MTKVILITIPSSSHINPLLPIVHNLIKNFRYKFIVYSTSCYKLQIEKVGAEFRQFQIAQQLAEAQQHEDNDEKIKIETIIKPNQRISRLALFITNLIDIAENNILYLAKEIYKEKPDLILFENVALHASLTIRLLRENFLLIDKTLNDILFARKLKVMYFSTTFLEENSVYPNEDELKISNSFNIDELVKIAIDRELVSTRAQAISVNFGISFIDPFHETFNADSRIINLILILPELHPRVYVYHRNKKFIGSIVDDNFTKNDTISSNSNYSKLIVNSVLQEFEQLKSVSQQKSSSLDKRHLIFIYLNCKLDENLDNYLKILDAFSSMSLNKLMIIISFNSQGSYAFDKLLKENNLKLNENIITVTNIERLEILKRSSAFITNGDISTINESLFCGVPILCLPVTSNQILNAHRISTELELGLTIDFTCFNKQEFIDTVNSLIHNSSYREKCKEFSKFYKKYQTSDIATKIINDFLNNAATCV